MAGKGITRRTFLSGSAAAAIAGSLPGCGSGVYPSTASTGASSGGSTAAARGPNSLPDPTRAAGVADTTLPFDHVVVVMMENHSFDSYLGMLSVRGQPLVDGLTLDASGTPTNSNPLDGGFQKVYHMQSTCQPGGASQSWDASHQQIDGGKMDGFAATGTDAMGYWDESDLPFYYSLAKTFCLGNRYFCSVPAQTYPNRRFLYSGTAFGTISTDFSGFSLPPPTNGTLMDVLSKYGVSWTNYFTDLPATVIIPQNLENHPTNYQPITQFFVDCLAGTLPSVSFVDPEFGLIDEVGGELFNFLNQVPDLPASITSALSVLSNSVQSYNGDEEGPSDIALGEAFVAQVVNAVMASPNWSRTLLIWTYDEHGGYYDHVPPVSVVEPDDVPPSLGSGDAPGAYNITGMRVPAVVVSPYSKPNAVTDVMHDHTSIIATIAAKWNLPALTYRDAQANTLFDFLDLDSPPAFLTPPMLAAPAAPTLGLAGCASSPPTPIISPTADAGTLGRRLTAAHRAPPKLA
jgi:phospholipase C